MLVSGPDLVVGGSPRIYAGEGALQRSGRSSVPICALALVAAKKRGPFMVRGSHALCQGTTLVGP
jgi:hypothetical protein